MKLKKIVLVICAAFAFILTGCNETENVWNPVNNNSITIAVIGDDNSINGNGAKEAMELASDDFYDKTGIKIKIEEYDDQKDYNKAITYAKKIADDNDIGAVLVKQELDYIDTSAEIFEESHKPFIITNGCYERTIDKSYDYILVNCINAKIAGGIMGKYVSEKKYHYAVFCHSDTEYEEDELKGFQNYISGTDVRLADTVVGPYTQEEFDIAYSRWLDLGVDVVCISNYNILNSNLVRMLREKGSDISVVGDYVMDTDDDISINGKYLDGTAIASMYVNDSNIDNTEITGRFKERYEIEMSQRAIQTYDTVTMLGEAFTSGVSDSKQLIEYIKSETGYRGISGTVAFDKRGCLIPNGNEMLVFNNGLFR